MRFISLLLIFLLNFACSGNFVKDTNSKLLAQNSIESTLTNQENKPNNWEIYTKVLESVYGVEVFARNNSIDYLIIKKDIITPQDIDEIRFLPDLPDDLINDFIEKNNIKGFLGEKENPNNHFDVDVSHNIIEQKGSLELFYVVQKKKFPKIDGIVGFSQIGFSSDKTQTLVYVEFYNPERGLQKKYCLITWAENDKGNLIDKYVKWIEAK